MANNSLIHGGASIPLIISDLSKQIAAVRRKTDTLIDYYIYPEPTPSEVSAYDPRLAILKTRLAALAKLSFPNFACLIDDSDALTASYLEDIVDQLLNAVDGICLIFENHYDRTLEERKPFDINFQILLHREKQLKNLKIHQLNDPQRLRAEELRPNEVGDFCRGAIQMLNGCDRGKISYVADRDLLADNRARLRQFGGAYLWWECPKCDFRLRYHLSDSGKTNILSTEEVRRHDDAAIDYKSVFLVKCHLFQPAGTRPGSSSGPGSGGNSNSGSIWIQRRQSRTIYPKYGCGFCYALGKELLYGVTTFNTGRELMMHMEAKHRKVLPPAPLLLKMNVAIKDKCAEGVHRWDINFK